MTYRVLHASALFLALALAVCEASALDSKDVERVGMGKHSPEDEGVFGAPFRRAATATATAPMEAVQGVENTRTLLSGNSAGKVAEATKESKEDMNERIRAVFSSRAKDDSTPAVGLKESIPTTTANSGLPPAAAELHGNTRHVMDVPAVTPPPPAGTDTKAAADKQTMPMIGQPQNAADKTVLATDAGVLLFDTNVHAYIIQKHLRRTTYTNTYKHTYLHTYIRTYTKLYMRTYINT